MVENGWRVSYKLNGHQIWQVEKTGDWRVLRAGDRFVSWGFDSEEDARSFANRTHYGMDAQDVREVYAEVRGEPVGT